MRWVLNDDRVNGVLRKGVREIGVIIWLGGERKEGG